MRLGRDLGAQNGSKMGCTAAPEKGPAVQRPGRPQHGSQNNQLGGQSGNLGGENVTKSDHSTLSSGFNDAARDSSPSPQVQFA